MAGKTVSVAEVNRLVESILATPLPAVRDPDMRDRDRKEWASAVRRLFKDLKIKGVSVTTPDHSMADSIRIAFPWTPDHGNYPGHDNGTCVRCNRGREAKARLETIILAAFPDLDDRTQWDAYGERIGGSRCLWVG